MADDQETKQKTKARDLEQQEWYHGYRPHKDVNQLLKEVGDFLVRTTDSGNKPFIVISVRVSPQKVNHLTLKLRSRQWQLGVLKKVTAPRFQTIVELVEHYRLHKVPGKICMKKPISRPKWHIKHDKVRFDRTTDLLGSGNFCHVYKGLYTKDDEEREKLVVAVKIWHAGSSAEGTGQESTDARDSMLSEAQLMSYYVHKNVIQLYGVACDHPPVMIVMEYCPGGNLEKHLRDQGDKIEACERLIYAMEAANGMRYLHSKNCVHRDLAARNCLISEAGRIKIADFGLSQLVADEKEKHNVGEDDVKMEPGRGPQIPVRWMAPESLRRPMQFSCKSDVWSYGVLLFEIFNNGDKPWPDDPAKRVATHIRKGRMPPFPEYMKQIWTVEPEKRPDMKAIVTKMHELTSVYRPPPGHQTTLNAIPGANRGQLTLDDTIEVADDDPQVEGGGGEPTPPPIEMSKETIPTRGSLELARTKEDVVKKEEVKKLVKEEKVEKVREKAKEEKGPKEKAKQEKEEVKKEEVRKSKEEKSRDKPKEEKSHDKTRDDKSNDRSTDGRAERTRCPNSKELLDNRRRKTRETGVITRGDTGVITRGDTGVIRRRTTKMPRLSQHIY